MGGRSRAALRREKKKKLTRELASEATDKVTTTDATRRQVHYQSTSCDSDSESSNDMNRAATIPLLSLEHGNNVRDFIKEMNAQQNIVGKRAQAVVQRYAVDQRKKRFREEKAEKIVWRKFDRENRAFEKYYEECLGLKKHDFARFLACLKEPLPVYLRVNGNYTSLSEIVTGSLELDFNMKRVTVPTPVGGGEMHVQLSPEAWVPQRRLWKITVDSKEFRKNEGLQSLRSFVKAQGNLGTLLRQDPAATVLPAFLDIHPGQRVLDLCGGGDHRAPIVEEYLCLVSTGLETALEKNLLLINERDATAAASAVRNLTRTLPLARDLIVTVHKPEEFPVPEIPEALFDRIICCPPCSGDGLIRKLPEKWRTWSPEQGLAFHPSQLGLTDHAMTLLRIGGTLLYSTRSLNPIENEAVVAEIIRRSKGALELVDTNTILEGLKRSHGRTKWTVLDLASWSEAPEDERHRLRPSMWPPSSEECNEMHLNRCVRLLPHQNDTHGLFLAVIRKVRATQKAALTIGPALPPKSKPMLRNYAMKKIQAKAEKAFSSFTSIDQESLASIQSFFALCSKPTFLIRAGMARQKRAVHVVTPALADLVTRELRGRLCIYHAGVHALRPCAGVDAVSHELTDNGARVLLPAMKAQVLSLSLNEFTSFLQAREMWLKNVDERARLQLVEMSEGSFAMVLDDMEPTQTRDRDIVLTVVKRHNSCSIVSSAAAIARVKALLDELNAADEGGEDGYDSLEFEGE
ncbi:hypothetical protein CCR75_005559 [Bremia lactucae]|uniref:SAM-dependent MTase RsmB/NOP-type domain-containing protein n=1 Tax=Bremia lactucae TaxID=4779 RepID=A0A976FLU8_BRELC|nr:hypothetical protein CCR75_005559 [Bremia lactucae]